MKRFLTVTGCTVAVFLSCGVATSIATADTPGFYKEGQPLAQKVHFTMHGTTTTEIVSTTGVVSCTKASGSGELTGIKQVAKVKLKFGCAVAGVKCTITTGKLKATLLFARETRALNGVETQVLDLTGEKEGPLARSTCASVGELSGSVLWEMEPFNTPTNTAQLIAAQKEEDEFPECGGQQFLYLEPEGPCIHGTVGEGGEPFWFVTEQTLTYALGAKVELRI
jgi:hypothetical protein